MNAEAMASEAVVVRQILGPSDGASESGDDAEPAAENARSAHRCLGDADDRTGREFAGDPDGFPHKETVVDYFVAYAEQIAAPVRCGVEVREVRRIELKGGVLQ